MPNNDPARILTYEFLTLPHHERIAIVRDLRLVAGKQPADETEFFRRCFAKAKRDKKLAELWDKVHHYARPDSRARLGDVNPYKEVPAAATDSEELLPFQEFYDGARKAMADAYDKAMKTGEAQVAIFSTNGWRVMPDGKSRIKIDSIEMTITPLKK